MRWLLLIVSLSACASVRVPETTADLQRDCDLGCLAALTEAYPDPKKIEKACGPCPGDLPETHPADDGTI